MTKLEAVNKLLRLALMEAPVSALDTGATSVEGQAETILDQHDKRIQTSGWHINNEFNVTLETADTTKVALVIAAGTWTVATKTLTDVASFASYLWDSGDQISVTGGTGVTAAWYEIASRTSDDAIVLKESIATANNADTVTDIIGWDDALVAGSDVLRMDNYAGSDDVVLRVNNDGNSLLYDRDSNTFTFGDSMLVTLTRQLDFINIPDYLQNLMIADAAVEFQKTMIDGQARDAELRVAALEVLTEARRKEQQIAQVNVIDTDHAERVQGQSYMNYPTRS